jgi:hypothetical protein
MVNLKKALRRAIKNEKASVKPEKKSDVTMHGALNEIFEFYARTGL